MPDCKENTIERENTAQKGNIIGLDEAGRGALAGSVYAGCVLVPGEFDCTILNDSKKLSENQREKARIAIMENCIFGIGFASFEEIDKLNIIQATFLAMQRAFENFCRVAEEKNTSLAGHKIIVDGNLLPPFLNRYENNLFSDSDNPTATCMVKADSKIHSVMAASIIAKTERDHYMKEQALLYPQYNYGKHKGYGTREHMDLIHKFGPSPIQRKTFKIV